MKKNLAFLSLLILIIHSYASAQEAMNHDAVGYFFDINGRMIDGYFDFDYHPEDALVKNRAVGDVFTPGCYYDKQGVKHQGLIRFNLDKSDFRFKMGPDDEEIRISPGMCEGFVVGVDSFAIMSDFSGAGGLGRVEYSSPQFVEVMDTVWGYAFYKHVFVGLNNVYTTYIFQNIKTGQSGSFIGGNKKFIEAALPVFGSYEYLAELILNNRLEGVDLPGMVKMMKYKGVYDRDGKVRFNRFWMEVAEGQTSAYYAKIDSIIDSVYHMQYFLDDGTLMFQGWYSAFNLQKKLGLFKYYSADGHLRKTIEYYEGKPVETRLYDSTGQMILRTRHTGGWNMVKEVLDGQGNSLLDDNGDGTMTIHDPVNERDIVYEFTGHRFARVWFLDHAGRKVFQFCDDNATFKKVKMIQGMVEKELVYPAAAIRNGEQGISLIKCVVEPSGAISDLELVRGINPVMDARVIHFLATGQEEKLWKPAKNDGEKVPQELIIPVVYSVRGFSVFRSYYYHDPYWFWNTMPAPSIPAPSFH